jgi:glycosidase
MRVLLDFAGTNGVPPDATILQQHPDWLVLNENNSAYYSWGPLHGIDTNRPDVQDYFVQVAKYYVQMFNIDGYRCDSAFASPYEMFEKIRAAIQAVKPDAVLIGEVSPDQPIYHETVFDATYDFGFPTFASSLPDSMSANKTASWLKWEIDSYPPGTLRLRYLEDDDLAASANYTTASKYGPAGDQAFAAFLFTVNGIPMIYNGQEVGNIIPQPGAWVPAMDWNANPQAAQFTSFYTKLIHIRLTYPALQQGATVPVNSTNGRVAAYARVLTGADPVLAVINFSNSTVNTTLGTSLQALGLQATPLLVNAVDNKEYPVSDIRSFNLSLEPYQEYILLPSTAIVRTETHTATPTASQSSTTPISSSAYSSTLQTSPGPSLPTSSLIEYSVVIVVFAAIAVSYILLSRKRARMPTKAKESTSEMKAKKAQR